MLDDTQPQTETPEEETLEANPSDPQPVEGVVDVTPEPAPVVEEVPTPEPLPEPQIETPIEEPVQAEEVESHPDDEKEEKPLDDTEVEIIPEETNAPAEITPPIVEVEPEPPVATPAPGIYDLAEASEKPKEANTEEKLAEGAEKAEEIVAGEMKPFTVRTEETGDKVYVVVKERRYWVRNPDTMRELGFNLGQEKKVAFSELLKWKEGEPVDLTLPNAIKPWDKPESEQDKVEEKGKPYQVWS